MAEAERLGYQFSPRLSREPLTSARTWQLLPRNTNASSLDSTIWRQSRFPGLSRAIRKLDQSFTKLFRDSKSETYR
jgi:hypothetical protein